MRGAAAGAVRALLFADTTRLDPLFPTLERMVRDPSIAVRSCVATALLPVLNQNKTRSRAVELFVELCDTEDVLLSTVYAEEFIRYATRTHFAQMLPIMDRMLCSDDPKVAQAGARQACLAAIGLEEASALVSSCLEGSTSLRTGAAQVLAANLGNATAKVTCELALGRLFDDCDEEVRAAAAECFRGLDGTLLAGLRPLIDRFVQSASFEAHPEHLLFALESSTICLPEITLSICEHFLKNVGEAAGDVRTRAATGAHIMGGLLIRTYNQATSEAKTGRCLDLIDRMLELGVHSVQTAIDEFDR